jgi:hypothetical protein
VAAVFTIKLLGGVIKPTNKKMSVSVEMPKYKSHKEVWALKIKSIVRDGEGENRESDGSSIITPEEKGYAPFRVEGDYLHKHKPQVGGYYVVYKDGYKSFSPAKAFEEGNTLIKENSFFDRILIEAQELATKTNALNDFMRTQKFVDLDRQNKDLLYKQSRLMNEYLQVLGQRIELLGEKFSFKQ